MIATGIAIVLWPFRISVAQSIDREFRIDAGHSTIEFEMPFIDSHVQGRFDRVTGAIVLPDSASGGMASASLAVVIHTAGTNTGSTQRDRLLRSSDFFDAGRYPELVFRSDHVECAATRPVFVGRLTMHGVARTVRIPFHVSLAPNAGSRNTVLAIFTGSVAVSRLDFGILGDSARHDGFNRARNATTDDSVRIRMEIHAGMLDSANPSPSIRSAIAGIDSVGIDSSVGRLRATFRRDSAFVAANEGAADDIGRVLLRRGRVRDGFTWLHALARLLPASPNAMVSVGVANERMGDTARARAWYDRAVAADSLNPRAMARLSALDALARRPLPTQKVCQ
ncbi:MAG TPA: YceI family protein [Gemmatimonadaceae bacterium]|nr:YceI family protein [Gemmatimonadaceae bacterium]